jgi:branched-subunit amino acid ABC-type transport system permease component
LIEQGLTVTMGAAPRTAPAACRQRRGRHAGVPFGRQPLAIVAVGGALVLAVWFLLERTQVGRRMRAVAADREMARAVGIPVRLYVTLSLALAGALAGVAGFLLGHQFLVTPTQGAGHMLKAYIAVAIGGWGSVPGALLGALAIGVFETFVSTAVGDAWARPPSTSPSCWCSPCGRAACSASRWAARMNAFWRLLLLTIPWSGWLRCRRSASGWSPGRHLRLLGLGYQIVFGQLRAFNLAQARLFGVGAYATALSAPYVGGQAFLVSILAAALVAALAAAPILRLQSHYFALATLALASLVNLLAVHAESLTGGANGLVGFGIGLPRGPILMALVWFCLIPSVFAYAAFFPRHRRRDRLAAARGADGRGDPGHRWRAVAVPRLRCRRAYAPAGRRLLGGAERRGFRPRRPAFR